MANLLKFEEFVQEGCAPCGTKKSPKKEKVCPDCGKVKCECPAAKTEDEK